LAIDHGSFVVRYSELGSVVPGIIAGATVVRGQVIGFVGLLNSGASMLHLEMYSGTKSGSLTVTSNSPFRRRADLIDATEFLDGATLNRDSGTTPPTLISRGSGKVSSRVETVLNLRSQADPASNSLGQLLPGTSLEIVKFLSGKQYNADGDTRTDWFEVKTDGKQGFVAAFYIDLEAQIGRVNSLVTSELNLRESPATTANVLDSLSPGTTVNILEKVTGSSFTVGGTTSTDWFKVDYQGKQGFLASLFIDVVETAANGGDDDNPNAILFTFQPKGASAATAGQDNLPGGVASSEKMAQTDRNLVMAHKSKFILAGIKFDLPPALLAAIASRESRGGNVLVANGFGPDQQAFGIMQVDKNFHQIDTNGGIAGQAHINQAASILKQKLVTVENAGESLPDSAQLQTAVSRYNGGAGRFAPNSDEGTTGKDYMNDVWARARFYAVNETWTT